LLLGRKTFLPGQVQALDLVSVEHGSRHPLGQLAILADPFEDLRADFALADIAAGRVGLLGGQPVGALEALCFGSHGQLQGVVGFKAVAGHTARLAADLRQWRIRVLPSKKRRCHALPQVVVEILGLQPLVFVSIHLSPST